MCVTCVTRGAFGYEGIALITVFSAIYLWLFRSKLRFPRALLVFPVGIVAIWLANILRVTTLVAIGSSISPTIAAGGFHSQAGWIGFTLVALGVIALSHRLLLSTSAVPGASVLIEGRGAAQALLAPLIALLATSMVISALSSGFNALYPIGVVTTGAVLWGFRRQYRGFDGGFSWNAIAIGVVIFTLWVFLERPDEGSGAKLAGALVDMPAGLATVWLVFRVVGSVVTVPLAEELAFRGYLIRKLIAADFETVRAGQFTLLSFLVSSLLFGLLHNSWFAGTLAGMGYAVALYRRGRLSDAIVAHATTNALIAVAVLAFGRWSLWI